jgi:hypothetical protein
MRTSFIHPHEDVGIIEKFVGWNLQVSRCGTLSNATRSIVVRPMAWAEVALNVM